MVSEMSFKFMKSYLAQFAGMMMEMMMPFERLALCYVKIS